MDKEKMKPYQEYVERTEEIRTLSTPSLKDIENADDYAKKLNENFRRIGELAAANREFLDNVFYPLMRSEDPLEEEDISEIVSFGDSLIDARSSESLDLPIMSVLSERLFEDAKKSGDVLNVIHQMDARIGTLYELMNMTKRLKAYPEISEHYRALGFSAGEYFLDLLKKDRFTEIEDMECREIILTNARYSIVFFEGISGDPDMRKRELDLLAFMLEIADDPFYQEALPEYDWLYHRFRVLQYYSLAPEHNNAAGFTKDELSLIYQKTKELSAFYKENEDYFREILEGLEDKKALDFGLSRSGYLAGEYSEVTYRNMLEHIYSDREPEDYSTGGGYLNLFVPLEAFLLIDRSRCSALEKYQLNAVYQHLLSYAFHMPNGTSVSVLLETYADFLDGFIEYPSGITFENMVLHCLAAFHPPTYVHSLMVAQMTECLCDHVIRVNPALLTGVLGCRDAEEVREKADEIIRFAYHAALCHDFGKIMIIDTIFVYGRKLLDMEFDLIKTHPKTGYEMMIHHASTRAYADVALGHHKWYDNSRGYPQDFDTSKSPLKPIIDIVLASDCLDAATDTVGRSYNKGKVLDDYLEELKEGSGTHYAPFLYDLMTRPEVHRDLEYLLTKGRKQNYRNTYYLLKEMQERSE